MNTHDDLFFSHFSGYFDRIYKPPKNQILRIVFTQNLTSPVCLSGPKMGGNTLGIFKIHVDGKHDLNNASNVKN